MHLSLTRLNRVALIVCDLDSLGRVKPRRRSHEFATPMDLACISADAVILNRLAAVFAINFICRGNSGLKASTPALSGWAGTRSEVSKNDLSSPALVWTGFPIESRPKITNGLLH